MEKAEGYDLHISREFAKRWKKRWVSIKGLSIEITEELISNVTGFKREGFRFFKKICDKDEEGKKLFQEGDLICPFQGGFLRDSLSKPFEEVAKLVIKYITEDGRYQVVKGRHLLGKKVLPLHQVVILLIHHHVLYSILQPIIGIEFRNSHAGGGPISRPPEKQVASSKGFEKANCSGGEVVGEDGEGSNVRDSLDVKFASSLLAMGKGTEGLNRVRKGQGKDFSPHRMKMKELVSNLVVENKVFDHKINVIVNFSKLSLECCLSQIKLDDMLVGKEILEHPKKRNKGYTSGGKRDRFRVLLKDLEATVFNMKVAISGMSH
ncbi:hypothetical protein KI387_009469 [Taxus chinensis]|uniref:Uncharacterized protein n=1 Tax=Taxus chinensis TaxID=29808 RepID=A0AA38FJA9_TAXCH|nr:hypothetical protein KI387_009469 [Taxus chinensis]